MSWQNKLAINIKYTKNPISTFTPDVLRKESYKP